MLIKSIVRFAKTITCFVKGEPLTKKPYKDSKHKDKQEINIIGSSFFDFWEGLGIILHILAFALGVSALVSEANSYHPSKGLEIATVFVVGVNILNYYLRVFISRYLIQSALSNFWNSNDVNVTTSFIKKMDYKSEDQNYTHAKIINQEDKTEIKNITIGWKGKLSRKELFFKYKNISNPGNDFTSEENVYIPTLITIDLKNQDLKILTKATIYDETNIKVWYCFNKSKKSVTWSGTAPSFPFFGEWEWK